MDPSTNTTAPRIESAIIRLKDGVNMDEHIRAQHQQHGNAHNVVYKWPSTLSNAYAGEFTPEVLQHLKNHENVKYISDNGPTEDFQIKEQTDAGWGLARIQRVEKISGKTWKDLDYPYQYDESEEAGAGVDIYIIDCGIYIEHNDFGGRAKYADDDDSNKDTRGHGTHVAGIAAGNRWGIAKAANLIAVKVKSSSGGTTVLDDVRCIDWVLENAPKTGRPSVVNLSRGRPVYNQYYNERVTDLVENGIHVVVAAGNVNWDARNTSPASAPLVNTVGATDIDDKRYTIKHNNGRISGSNYGPCVDFFAPGMNIPSCWIGNKDAYDWKTGTSMAAPLVTGMIATYISLHGNLPPHAMTVVLRNHSLKGKIDMTGIDGITPMLTANALVRGAFHISTKFSFSSMLAAMRMYSPAIFAQDKNTIYPQGSQVFFTKDAIFTTTFPKLEPFNPGMNVKRAGIRFTVVSAYPYIDASLFRTGNGDYDNDQDNGSRFSLENGPVRADGKLQKGQFEHEVIFKNCPLE